MPEVAVVGGGITGLAAAWALRGRADVTLLERDDRLGGKINTRSLSGVPVEAGPDTFLARQPDAVELCRSLGLGDDLVAPANGKAWIWTGGRLSRLPEPNVLGVPLSLRSVMRSPLLSASGKSRALADLVLPGSRQSAAETDPSVAEVVGRRLGREVLDRLVEPLVGGIHAGRADTLSLASTASPLADAAARHRSLILGLRARPASPSGPVFLGVAGGMERIVERLADHLGAAVRTSTAVTSLDRTDAGRWRLACEPGPDVEADSVILAVPSFAAAVLLERLSPEVAAELRAIEHASVVVVTLGYRPAALPAHPDGAGFLVPRVDGRLMTACTWTTSKWPELRRGGMVLLRASAGRFGDDRPSAMDDPTLVGRLHEELAEALGITESPETSLVDRWPRAFPQYASGHAARVDRIETAVRSLGGVLLAGASYRGVGVAACIRQGTEAATRAL